MTGPPERFRAAETVDEILEELQAARRGQPRPKAETAEYRQARREALARAGLDTDDEPGDPVPLEEMGPDDHFEDVRRSGA